ncbi:MAG: SH3 domain-containing protein, partial [Christensenellales bacterium]
MKRAAAAIMLSLMLLTAAAPVGAFAAAPKTVYILNVENDGARVRKHPNSDTDNVETSLRKDTKVFYLGKSGAWTKIRSEYGVIGYTYAGYLKYYGAASLKSIYMATGRTNIYKKPATSAKRVTRLSKGQHVIVYATQGKWAYVHTLSG